ncbi:MAG: hypothetical protein HOQ28_06785 [Thermoleophilia bacterium]|nr:hypothetical protein [Thermoleophilia bacterium]
MAESSDTSAGDTNRKGEFGRRLAQKALMPIVATAASAAAGYAAKKGPRLFEEKVLPKLKEAANGAGAAVEEIPARAKSAAENVGDLAEGLTQRAKDVAPGGGAQRRTGALSQADLDRHVKQRAEARAARRKATSKR